MSREPKIPFGLALEFAERAAQALGTLGDPIVAGSIRRMKTEVGDIDLVMIGDPVNTPIFQALSQKFAQVVPEKGNGAGRPRVSHQVSLGDRKIKIDVWAVPEEILGSTLLHATGSGLFNVVIRRWARRQGMMFDYRGVWKGDEVIASRTEEECFAALGLPFYRPQDRHEDSLSDLLNIMEAD